MASETWICGDCRSANGAKQTRCYKCHVPRVTAELTEQAASIAAVQRHEAQTVLAKAERMGVRYRPSWPVALLVVPTILVATGLTVAWTNSIVDALGPGGEYINDFFMTQSLRTLGIVMLISLVVGWLVWCAWSAIVVANVPALTTRYPSYTPAGAFLGHLRGWRGGYRIMRGVLVVLTDGRAVPLLITRLWWAALLLAYLAPLPIIVLRGTAPVYTAIVIAMQVRLVLMGIAAILAISLVLIVEREQRAALARRAQTLVADRHVLA